MRRIWARVRWHLDIDTADFKLPPNKHRTYYARYWLEQHPEHPKLFRVRSLPDG